MSAVETPPRVHETQNLAEHLWLAAERRPERAGVIAYARTRGPAHSDAPRRVVSNHELRALSARIASGLAARGVVHGDRVCVFVRPGVELVAILYALFALGAVPVMVDPGLGRRALLSCIERTKPRVFLGIPLAHAVRHVFRRAFRSVELAINVGPPRPLCGPTLERACREGSGEFTPGALPHEADAAILFTSGSTGPPKGVVYTHAMFDAQVSALKNLYRFGDDEIDVACLPAFGLFGPALGLTAVFPDLDPSRPGSCDPRRIVNALEENRATNTFGSPAIWRRVVPWCVEHGVRLPHLRRVLIAGAPVPPHLIEPFLSLLSDDADVFTPYGATECLPVASVGGRELLASHRARSEQGEGTCVGTPVPEVTVRIIEITDDELADWDDAREVETGELGEITVSGAMATERYDGLERATREAKIRDGERVVHRMGDLGYRDDEGRLWFCGRKSHRLETADGLVSPVPVENVFNPHPDVMRTALVGVGERGAETPVLVIELEPGRRIERERLLAELRELGSRDERAARVETFLFHPGFPTDVRHNAKIHRGELRDWARAELRGGPR